MPIILESLTYDFSGDPSYLQVPRSTEAEIYDFVIQEVDTLASLLPVDAGSKSRASAAAALAMFETHGYTITNQPRFGAEEEEGGALNPSLNLVQSFERLDNTFAPLPTVDDDGNPIYYDNQEDIFANRDARLGGTVILLIDYEKHSKLYRAGGFGSHPDGL